MVKYGRVFACLRNSALICAKAHDSAGAMNTGVLWTMMQAPDTLGTKVAPSTAARTLAMAAPRRRGEETDMATDNDGRRERDMILAPNEFAFISDETKGDVNVYVGPNKTSLAGTDRPVTFDGRANRYQATDLQRATQTFQTAAEGWYIVLENPAEADKHPSGSGKLSTPTLRTGKKVNISGPVTFPLWPGQIAKAIQGHGLRSNEYLLVRVYDEAAAKANFAKAVIKSQDASGEGVGPASPATPASDVMSVDQLTMGKLFIIKGTEVSFYIPSTGIEVVPEVVSGEERYVRQAVTLEQLEYCLLLDQNGTKRYVHGPAVVFPKPTEEFVKAPIKSDPDKLAAKKFRAQELTPNSGIHIKVIADYKDEDGTAHEEGEELFITGADQKIYFPRPQHATIKYGEQDIHYGIAIPPGEARYVLDRDTGKIETVKGPQIFLADPRRQVIVNRALSPELCGVMYPNNDAALTINLARLGMNDQDIHAGGGGNQLGEAVGRTFESYGATAAVATSESNRRMMIRGASKSLPGDSFDRKTKFTAPRAIVLNTKFDGAVMADIWSGYAMLVISKSGERRVIEGPQTAILDYDESPQVMTMSTGKPKTTDNLVKDVYLKTHANMVSDIVDVETADFCRVQIKLSYRVNFEGEDKIAWFAVDNYVKFLCDHMRSMLRAAVQKLSVQEFYGHHTDIVRDVILGKQADDGKRPGRAFAENGMRVYDVEVLGATLQDQQVQRALEGAQRESIAIVLELASGQRKLEQVKALEALKREEAAAKAETTRTALSIEAENARMLLANDLAKLEANARLASEQQTAALAAENARSATAAIELARANAAREAELDLDEARQALRIRELEAQVQAVVEKAKAVSPDLIAALSAFGEREMVGKVAQSMAPLGIIGGKSVVDVLSQLLAGTALGKQLQPAASQDDPDGTPAPKGRGRKGE